VVGENARSVAQYVIDLVIMDAVVVKRKRRKRRRKAIVLKSIKNREMW
jgi:hypothetical protein